MKNAPQLRIHSENYFDPGTATWGRLEHDANGRPVFTPHLSGQYRTI